MIRSLSKPGRLAAALTALTPLVPLATGAQTLPPTQPSAQTVVITGNPLGRDTATQAGSVLEGSALALRRAGSLGETLDGLPGVTGSGFGPNASRPVIRGLDGDRVRLLDNGGASIDASNLSFDHASATDPLVAERIEVLRGPSALLYGGNATGGVVNSIDNRIPKLVAEGLSGRAEVRLGGASAERAGAAVLEGGGNGLAWHADAFGRNASDLRTPRFVPQQGGQLLAPATQVRNSAAQSGGGALGAGWVGAAGYLGVSLEGAKNHYGVTAEPDVTIRMQRQRAALAGEWRSALGPFTQLQAQTSRTRYEHREVSGDGTVGTTFSSDGHELRLQAQHAPLGELHGVLGLQTEALDFSALGEEAFVPGTHTRSSALFLLEDWHASAWHVSAGLRQEQVRVASDGDAHGAATPRFGSPQQRRFNPASASLAATVGQAQGWQGTFTLGSTERAPAYYELFADGLHVATAAFERGDATLGVERSRHTELGLAFTQGAASLRAALYQTRFARFIALDATGQNIATAAGRVPEYAFRAVPATMSGFELEGRSRLPLGAGLTLELNGTLDRVIGRNQSSGEALPRLAPLRARLNAELRRAGWRVGTGIRHSADQTRVPATDTATPGFTMLDLWAWADVGEGDTVQGFARLGNVTNRLAYNASSVATIRGLSPMAGRALSVGLRARF